MKKLSIIAILTSSIIFLISCGDGVKRKPSRVYMPDMFYSRAYETYGDRDSNLFTLDTNLAGKKIFYNNMPVPGTIARGAEMPFPLAKDTPGDTANYVASKNFPNPEPPLTKVQMEQTHQLYLIHCGICHGANLDGNGPLYKGGEGPFTAAPKNLIGDKAMIAMPEGQMFYSITYGKNLMGSYASQLTEKQRWQLVHYIKVMQAEKNGTTATAAVAGSEKK